MGKASFTAAAKPSALHDLHKQMMWIFLLWLLFDPAGAINFMYQLHMAFMPGMDPASHAALNHTSLGHSAVGTAHAAVVPTTGGAENLCPAPGGAFQDYKQVFDCGTPAYQEAMRAQAELTRMPLETTVANMCSTNTVVTNKVWDFTPS